MTTPAPSDIYFAAAIAAENALPPESLKLITDRDELEGKARAEDPNDWYKNPELQAAGKAVDADPLAKIAMEIRRQGNRAASAEWRARQANNAA